jgi:hypothetical protein
MSVAALDLDLEVFQGPFDVLLTLVLREEVDLLESSSRTSSSTTSTRRVSGTSKLPPSSSC